MMQPNHILVDFLIPQFQDERIIGAIRSIISHPEAGSFRVIVLDGGRNTELQKKISAELRAQDIHRIAPDRGIYDALNAGIQMATADWIGWIGSDDLLASTFTSNPLQMARSDINFLSYTTLFFRESDGRILRVYEPVGSAFLRRNGFHLPHFSTFVRTPAAQSIEFDIEQKAFADQIYMYQLEEKFDGKAIGSVSTLMCAGGLSNSSVFGILGINREVYRAISKYKSTFGSVAYVFMKLLYKVGQRIRAIFFKDYISNYGS